MLINKSCLNILLMISLVSFFIPSLTGETTSLSGRVFTEEMIPLDNVLLLIDGQYQGVTDNEGYFILEGLQPDQQITFYRYGYHIQVLTQQDVNINKTIVLKREAMAVPGLKVQRDRETISTLKDTKIVIPITPEMKGKSLGDILSAYPEINLSGTNLTGERQTIALLGHRTRHTLVLLDGIPLNSNGQPYDISKIPSEIVESVEIIKSGASAYRGGGAIGGLININTKTPVHPYDISLSQSFGSFGLMKTAAAFYRRQNWLGFSIYADRTKAKNDFVYYDNNEAEQARDYNDKLAQNLFLRLSGHFTRITTLYKFELFSFANKLPGPTNFATLYRDARLEGLSLHHNLSLYWHLPGLNPEVTIFQHNNRTEYDNTRAPVPFYFIKSEHTDTKRGGRIDFDSPLNSYLNRQLSHPLIIYLLGDPVFWNQNLLVEYSREDFRYDETTNPGNSIPEISQDNCGLAAFSQLTIPVGRVDWGHSFAGRMDYWNRQGREGSHTSEMDRFFSWRYDSTINLYQPLLLTIGAGFSRNYSLPSYYDLYWKGDSQTVGNPDLEIEQSQNFTLFGEFTHRNLTPRIEYHQSKIADLIYWYRSNTGWKPGNISSAEITNLQLAADYDLHKIFRASFSWIRTTPLNKTRNPDGSPGDLYDKKLLYTPEESYNVGFTIRPEPFYIRINHSYTGIQWSTPDQLIPPLSAYRLTDTELGVDFKMIELNWLLSLSLNNIFDSRYEIYAYTPQPGFNWLLNLQINYPVKMGE